VEWSTQNGSEYSIIVQHVASNTFSYTIEKLSAGEQVNVTIFARNFAGAGGLKMLQSASSNF